MELRQLQYLVAVAEELSFTRAAVRSHIAQSGLSHQIARLERELGEALFDRSGRSVELTPAGATLLPYARRAIAEAENGVAAVTALAGVVRGRLRLGLIPVNHGRVDLADLLQTYHFRYPAVDVVVSDTGSVAMVEMVLSGEIDAAFLGLHASQLPPDLAYGLLGTEPLVAIVGAGHPCAGLGTVAIAELAQHGPFIDCHHDSGLRRQVDAAFVRAGATRHIAFELGNLMDVARMATLGLGVAIVPHSLAAALPDSAEPDKSHAVLQLNDPAAIQPLALVYRDSGPRSPATRAFLEQVSHTLSAAVVSTTPDGAAAQAPTML